MAQPSNIELSERSLKLFDDLHSYNEVLKKTMVRASEILEMKRRGLSAAEKKALKVELPIIVRTLRLLLKTQLEQNGEIAKLDVADGSYDNANLDKTLLRQLSSLRTMDVEMNRLIGTKTVRNISGTFNEDLPYWFGIKWREAKDNLKNVLKTAGVVGGLSAAGLLGGYALYHGGLIVGAGVLGKHLGVVGSYLASGSTALISRLSLLKARS